MHWVLCLSKSWSPILWNGVGSTVLTNTWSDDSDHFAISHITKSTFLMHWFLCLPKSRSPKLRYGVTSTVHIQDWFNGCDWIAISHIEISAFLLPCFLFLLMSRSAKLWYGVHLLMSHVDWHVLKTATCHSDSWLTCAWNVESVSHLSLPDCATCP